MKVTSKQVIKALLKHKGHKANAAKELGVQRQSIQKRIHTDPAVKSAWKKFVETLEREGGTNRKIARTIVAALDAETTKSVRVDGGEPGEREEVTEPDHYARLKATDQCLKIKRLILTDEDPKPPEQHLHLHFEDKKTNELYAEIMSQIAERRNIEPGVQG